MIPIREEIQILNDRIAQPNLKKEKDEQQHEEEVEQPEPNKSNFSIKKYQTKSLINILESFRMVSIITKWRENVYKLMARIFSLMAQDTKVQKVYGL